MLAKWSPLKLAKLAILASLLVALRFLRGFLVIAALIIAVRKTSIWPSAILGFVALGIPIILLGLRSWNRWFHPDRLPARWPKYGEHQFQNLETVLVLYGVAAFLVMVVMGFLVHDNASLAVLLPSWICCAALAWSSILGRYVKDRKFIPPPSAPHDPLRTWLADMKPFRSEHWGERHLANSDPRIVP
jgi:hypothetical protein